MRCKVSSEIFDKIVRYTAFSAAVYQDDCTTPPFNTTIVKSFDDANTDTQAAIYKDDKAKEIIVAFRGTSTPRDLDSDLAFALVPLDAGGTKCADCKVRPHSLPLFSLQHLKTRVIGSPRLSSSVRLSLSTHCRSSPRSTLRPRLATHCHWPLPRRRYCCHRRNIVRWAGVQRVSDIHLW